MCSLRRLCGLESKAVEDFIILCLANSFRIADIRASFYFLDSSKRLSYGAIKRRFC